MLLKFRLTSDVVSPNLSSWNVSKLVACGSILLNTLRPVLLLLNTRDLSIALRKDLVKTESNLIVSRTSELKLDLI